ncbi:MAG TPA: carboxypeptidase-like regulatory domain-containing protein, partial [Terriglobia bacterium]|nr:carboxypeptidase-like regulatory domain-containing protein [Terriglobia bacterium]
MRAQYRPWTAVAAVLILAAFPPLSLPHPQLASASIEGVVLKLGSTEPVVGAVVELSWRQGPPGIPPTPGVAPPPAAPPQVRTVTTGDDGKFAFRNLPANEYRLVATRPGGTYNPAQYGQRDPRSQGTPLTLGEGQAMKDVRLDMAVTSAITGRVYDRNGDPVAYARVLAMQAWYHEGNRLLDFVQVVHTNDRGEYRLFWLPPGKYFVAARPEAAGTAGATNFVNTPDRIGQFHEEVSTVPPITRTIQDNEVVSETYELTFYGGQTNPLRAQAIDLRPGMTVPGIDIPLAAGTVRPRTIKGIVIDGAT